MSSLSFDNVFSQDTSECLDGVTHLPFSSRSPGGAVPRAAVQRATVTTPRTAADASAWALSSMRRAIDVSVAGFALIVFLPVMLCAAVLVRWGSPGPVLFRQRRMGRYGREFTLYKFRSMCPRKGSNSSITVSGDVRITPVGALLRRYKLDELPQFWNVLRGDMSLVGPRPKLPHHEALHMACRPGITGVATLAFRNEEEFLSEIPEDQLEMFYEMFVKPAKAQLDMEYMHKATPASDLKILWRTASACLFSGGDSLTESAQTIIQYEAAARLAKQPPRSHPVSSHGVYAAASMNQEL